MQRIFVIVTMALSLAAAAPAFAAGPDMRKGEPHAMSAATDYRFELVGPPKSGGSGKNIVSVKLVHNGKPVPGAIVIQSRADMGPIGMAGMAAPIKPLGEEPPGTYRYRVRLTQAGDALQLSFSNAEGDRPLAIAAVGIAEPSAATGTEIGAHPLRPLTFSGQSGIALPEGHTVVSDPLAAPFRVGQDVIVSVTFTTPTRPARTNLGLAIGTNVQAWDADLDALAALSGTNTIYYRSAANTWTGVTIGALLQFSGGTLNVGDAELVALASLTSANNKCFYWTGSATAASTSVWLPAGVSGSSRPSGWTARRSSPASPRGWS